MFEHFAGISVKGRCFDQEQSLKFFGDAKSRLSLIYGANGSGKSTISQAFKALAGNQNDDLCVHAINHDGQPMEQEFTNIHVFDEEYIDRTVKLQPVGLSSIILLGDDVDVQQQIDDKQRMLKEATARREKAKKRYDEFLDSKNPVSPQYHFNRIKEVLKQPDGWAKRDSKIKGNVVNSAVTDSIVHNICSISVDASVSELQAEFEAKTQLLARTADPNPAYMQRIPQPKITIDEDRLLHLLSLSLERPVMSKREKRIFDVIQQGHQVRVQEAKECFAHSDQDYCPFCFQTVSDAYREELIQSIRNVLNEDADMHKVQLVKARLGELSVNYEPYRDMDASIVAAIQETVNAYNDMIKIYNDALDEKAKNIYTPIVMQSLGMQCILERLQRQIMALENARQKYVHAATERATLKNELIKLNKQLAYYECQADYQTYLQQSKKLDTAKQQYEEQDKQIQDLTSALKRLQDKKAKLELAVDKINSAMAYVFFSNERLTIELHDGCYYLKSRGKDVRPKDVSQGERNIIALCYFFYQIAENRNLADIYAQEQLLILDDPISSFDFENKVGILSLLRREIKQVIFGNNSSKVMVLTHDLATAFDMNKVFAEISKAAKAIPHKQPASIQWKELYHHDLIEFRENRSEYAQLINDIFNYAQNEASSDNGIGNKMRRVLEAFSSFLYSKGISEMLCNQDILDQLDSAAGYFENRMYRIVLNSESHYHEQVKNFHDGENFYRFISDDEKRSTAKDVLCFIYLLNKQHIKAYLNGQAVSVIEDWCADILRSNGYSRQDVPDIIYLKTVPLYDLPLSAGRGIDVFDDSGYEDYSTNRQNCDLALRISGDSMEPDIPNGSIVLIHRQETLDGGRIGAFLYNGELFCKKRVVEKNHVRLLSLNPSYKPIEIQDSDELICYGEVIEVIHKEN